MLVETARSSVVDKTRERFRSLLVEHELDHAILCDFANIRYATGRIVTFGFETTNDRYVAIVDRDGDSTFIMGDIDEDVGKPFPVENAMFPDAPWITRAIAGPSWQSFWDHAPLVAPLVVAELRDAGARRVGVDVMHFDLLQLIERELPDVEFVPIGLAILEARKVKFPEEIALTERAVEICSIAMSRALNAAEESATDREIVGAAVDATYRHGAEWISHHLITVNEMTDFPLPSGRRVWRGDAVLLDIGCFGPGGYAADFCRMRFVGGPRPEVEKAYRVVLEAQAAGVELARPGTRCSELTKAIDGVLEGRGYQRTPYAMGHGTGLRMSELPSIYYPAKMLYDDVLEEGMVICLEPSTFVESRGTMIKIKNEDQYVVEATGLRKLTPSGTAID